MNNRVFGCSPPSVEYIEGTHDGSWPVARHQHQRVDGDVGSHVDDVLRGPAAVIVVISHLFIYYYTATVWPAPDEAKGPVCEDVVTCGAGDADLDIV